MNTTPPTRIALRGDLLDFTGTPEWAVVDSSAVRFRADHWLLIENGRIQGAQPGDQTPDASWNQHDHRGKLLLPGFIDTHVHSPQIDMIASYGTELLDWLNTYTFPAEMRFADPAEAQAGATRFLDALLASGTTSAVVFPTVHKVSAEALFAGASARGMRLITGKVLMDRNAPAGLCDDVAKAEADCVDLIDRWHGKERLAYAVTVRFAPTSTPAQLSMAGRLCAAYPTTYMQTHVAENRDEVRWVRELFPEARSYLDVYSRAGLLHPRSVLAHGVWLDDNDRAAVRDSGALADAYKIQALNGQRLTAWKALHAATLGSAQALGLADEIGSFEVGRTADVCVWDWACGLVAQRRDEMTRSLHERVFAWLTLSDERNLVCAYVAGVNRYPGSAPN